MISISVLFAVGLDWLAGEPKRWHPLVGFGTLAKYVERRLNVKHPDTLSTLGNAKCPGKFCGAAGVVLLCMPLPSLWFFLLHNGIVNTAGALSIGSLLEAVILYFTIGHRSLWDHIRPIAKALQRQDVSLARYHTSMIVSRDPDALDIEVSAIESALENGNDALFGALFWFVVAGGSGALFYRLVNTLDAMWGYRTARYNDFGWAAANLDDVLNYLPARCTALSYAVLSDCGSALKCWREQASAHASPNGGPVISAGAGGLGILLGGPTRYQGVWHEKPVLGRGRSPNVADIQRAMRLVTKTMLLWVVLIACAELLLLILNLGGWH